MALCRLSRNYFTVGFIRITPNLKKYLLRLWRVASRSKVRERLRIEVSTEYEGSVHLAVTGSISSVFWVQH
jgi:hypothetical protein